MRASPYELWDGAGNRFLVLAAETLPPGWEPAAVARRLCPGRADGLLLLRTGERAELFNADGSGAAFCGNGARCLVARALERGAAEPVALRLGSVALMGERTPDGYAVHVPAPEAAHAGEARAQVPAGAGRLPVRILAAQRVVAGVPHLCLQLAAPPPEALPLGWSAPPEAGSSWTAVARRWRQAGPDAPAGTNVDIFWPHPDAPAEGAGAVGFWTYERGVERFTGACGSGALAVAAMVAAREGVAQLKLQTASGAWLEVACEGPAWTLSGPAICWARGSIAWEPAPRPSPRPAGD